MPGTSTHVVRPFVGGDWETGVQSHAIVDVYTREPLAEAQWASVEQVERALISLQGYPDHPISPFGRYEVLSRCADFIRERRGEFIETLVSETGFLVAEAEREVERTIQTLLLSGEESKRLVGHMVPLAADPTAPERIGYTIMRPLGVVCVITPFNSPLNMIAHKAGPAIAAGNSVIIKPAELTPLSADLLVKALLEAGLPEDSIALVHGGADVGRQLGASAVPAFYSFTGSTAAGQEVARAAGLRRSQLELGAISHTIIADDADPQRAAQACISGGFRKAGQVCTSVQKVLVHTALARQFAEEVVARLAGRVAGDPRLPETFMGPVITDDAAERISGWTQAAIQAGADAVVTGPRHANLLSPTVLANVPEPEPISCREVFGPVLVIESFDDFGEAISRVNATPFGLTAGVFTSRLDRIQQATERLAVGTVHINETSSARLDLMPFGGIKASGRGVEGPAYAIREMSQERFITVGP
jgi:succinate-semialdehyde dehydrogenase/glutarate-semialdehyde dehydrogenase